MSEKHIKKPTWLLFLVSLFFVGCTGDYLYTKEEPSWLGPSIYDYLANDGHYNNIAKFIDVAGYKDILQRTGSKTLFIPNDSAFEAFYKNNQYGIRSINDVSPALAKSWVKGYMIGDAIVSNLLGYNQNYGLGSIRRYNHIGDLDSVYSHDPLSGQYWSAFRSRKNMHFKKTFGSTILFFKQDVMDLSGITNEDFELMTGRTHEKDEFYVFDAKVIKRDITCKNGYINVLDKVLMPPQSMYQYMRKHPNLSTFTKLLERFSYPVFTNLVINPTTGKQDSVFYTRIYNTYPGDGNTPSDGGSSLVFDPNWPDLCPSGNSGWQYKVQVDGAAVFAPTNEAFRNYYLYESQLTKVYGVTADGEPNWEAVPNSILAVLLNNHFKSSLKSSVASKFGGMLSDMGVPMNLDRSNIDVPNSQLCSNGLVYAIKKVCAPPSLGAVSSAILYDSKCKVFQWGIANLPDVSMPLSTYLSSTDATFTLFVPKDSMLTNIIDPVSLGYTIPYKYKFVFNHPAASNKVCMIKYNMNGDSLGVITDQAIVKNRLEYVLRSHIIVGAISSNKRFYQTLNSQIVEVTSVSNPLSIQGGGNKEQGITLHDTQEMPLLNGTSFYMNGTLQYSLKSPYKVLSTTPEFSKFYDLLSNAPEPVFVKGSVVGIDFNTSFLSSFNFTLFVPTNAAIDQAISDGTIKTWDAINSIGDATIRAAEIKKMMRFLKNHYMDNSVYIGNPMSAIYTTKAVKTNGTYSKLKVQVTGTDITINDGSAKTTGNLKNILTTEYFFNSSIPTSCTLIGLSTQVVIHQIDKVLPVE
jgi:uncharacterized surface protein with fasciclin (FAS1) repeats